MTSSAQPQERMTSNTAVEPVIENDPILRAASLSVPSIVQLVHLSHDRGFCVFKRDATGGKTTAALVSQSIVEPEGHLPCHSLASQVSLDRRSICCWIAFTKAPLVPASSCIPNPFIERPTLFSKLPKRDGNERSTPWTGKKEARSGKHNVFRTLMVLLRGRAFNFQGTAQKLPNVIPVEVYSVTIKNSAGVQIHVNIMSATWCYPRMFAVCALLVAVLLVEP